MHDLGWAVASTAAGRQYDPSSEGRRFLTIRNPPESVDEQPNQLVVVENWLAELEGRTAN